MRSSNERVLILGYGNPLRGDDGLGRRAADLLQKDFGDRADVRVIGCQQLVPELAQEIAAADRVIFVDACCDGGRAGQISERAIGSGGSLPALGHHLTPEQLVELAEVVYGTRPPALAVAMSAKSFEYRNRLSAPVKRALPVLLDRVRALISEPYARTVDC